MQDRRRLMPGTVSRLAEAKGEDEDLVVQVSEIGEGKGGKTIAMVSDGHHCIKGFFQHKEKITACILCCYVEH
jgi:hypothetical protein